MCGIAGIIDYISQPSEGSLLESANLMADAITNRGPDDNGVWVDEQNGIALSHRRLSIIDRSSAGQQPMMSNDGRYIIAYNGEIYNFKELRNELKSIGKVFKGNSDTEVILEACATWGIHKTIGRLIGMFAFALWDKKEKTLYLVRDRLGIKPLYWGSFGSLFLFGSELKALRAHRGWEPKINRDALTSFMRFSYVPSPMSIYEGISKLAPGCILTIQPGKKAQLDSYWSLSDVVRKGKRSELDVSDDEATDALDNLLSDAVSRRMVADVPLGAFLSGGIDSSTIVALMQAQSSRPVHSYSIGFQETGFNEAQHAADVARHLGTDHTELYVTPKEAQEVIAKLPDIYDEPFADSSQIPTYLVSSLTRRHVTVALSGDGGDECFAGYNRYVYAERIRRAQKLLPKAFRGSIASLVRSISPKQLDDLANILPSSIKPNQVGDRLHKLMDVLSADEEEFYPRLISHWDEPERLVYKGNEKRGVIWDPAVRDLVPDFIEHMQYLDLLTYLPDDILTKVDRASMAVSLETRVPLLDHRVVEFSCQLPMRFKIRDGKSKWLLRQVLYKHMPKELVERPKMGFGVPIGEWLRGPLREWAEALLDEAKINGQGYLNYGPIKQKWEEHLSGKRNWQYQLWNVLMFQAWHERWMNS